MAAKPRRSRKIEDETNGQIPLPTPPAKAPSPTRVFPMELQIGDRLTDETGDREIISRPYTTNMGKGAHVRVRRIDPDMTEIRTWVVHERVSVTRT